MDPHRIENIAIIRVTSLTAIVRLMRRSDLDFGCAPLVRERPPGVYHLTLLNSTDSLLADLRSEGYTVETVESSLLSHD